MRKIKFYRKLGQIEKKLLENIETEEEDNKHIRFHAQEIRNLED